uniref:Uncharacterized protein n=1 Tax=viral metagenome TaxID=1070528 RepID=A0A6C0DAT2_9ZZZZ
METSYNSKQNCCFYSSTIFLVNSIVAFWFDYYLYSFFFFLLVITSLVVHSNNNIYTNIMDKISILFIVFYGGWLFYKKCLLPIDIKRIGLMITIVSTFLITIYLYYFGYINRQYCFCEDNEIANQYHSFLHLVSSFGHILIILL